MKTFQIAAAAQTQLANTAISALVEVYGLRDKVHNINSTLMMSSDEIAQKVYSFLWNESSKGTRGLKESPWTICIKHNHGGKTILTNVFGKKISVLQFRADKTILSDNTLDGLYRAIEYILDQEVKAETVEVKY